MLFVLLETGTVRIWHSNTYRLESTLNYGMDRVWTMACMKGSNNVAIGYDDGSIMVKVSVESKKRNIADCVWYQYIYV